MYFIGHISKTVEECIVSIQKSYSLHSAYVYIKYIDSGVPNISDTLMIKYKIVKNETCIIAFRDFFDFLNDFKLHNGFSLLNGFDELWFSKKNDAPPSSVIIMPPRTIIEIERSMSVDQDQPLGDFFLGLADGIGCNWISTERGIFGVLELIN